MAPSERNSDEWPLQALMQDRRTFLPCLSVDRSPRIGELPRFASWGAVGGLALSVLFVLTGLVSGLSTVFSSTWSLVVSRPFFQQPSLVTSRGWRLAYAAGLILGAAGWWALYGHGSRMVVTVPIWQLFVGGLLVGYGARLSQGCTSGHGICGLASLSRPSLAAVLTFMGTALLTANVMARLAGG